MVLKLRCFGQRSEIPRKFRNVVMEKISWTDHVRNEEVLLELMSRGISYMK